MSNIQKSEDGLTKQPESNGVMSQQANTRVMSEVQSRMVVAKRFPRDELGAIQRIKKSCRRPKLAESARYSYPRGGTRVTGPSIRLAEAIAQQWGNIDFGFKELDQRVGEDGIKESEVEAFAWDLQTNTRIAKNFTVKHVRDTKQGAKILDSQRDIYEMVANQGARRLRSCILAIIPQDVIDEALDVCKDTIKGNNELPLEDRIKKMLDSFEKFSVTKEMIEGRLGHKVEALDETEFVSMIDIYNSLKDGMSSREDWFDVSGKGKSKDSEKPSVADAAKDKTSGKKNDDSEEDEDDYYEPSASRQKKLIDQAGNLDKKHANAFAKFVSKGRATKEEWDEWIERIDKAVEESD